MSALPGERGFTDLIFRLPPELRNQIYMLSLPKLSECVALRDCQPEMAWMASSEALFAEAAIMFYGATKFYAFTLIEPRSQRLKHQIVKSGDTDGSSMVQYNTRLSGDYFRHLSLTYGPDGAHIVSRLAGRMIKELALDLRIDDAIKSTDVPAQISAYVHGIDKHFPALRKLYVYFGPSVMIKDPGLLRNSRSFKKRLPRPDEGDFTIRPTIEQLQDLVPNGCRIFWRMSEMWSMFSVGPRPQSQTARQPVSVAYAAYHTRDTAVPIAPVRVNKNRK
jgi:hypothetical protein